MKKLFLTANLCLASFFVLYAEEVPVERAEQYARSFLSNQSRLRQSPSEVGLQLVWTGAESHLRAEGEPPMLYVFNRTDAPGFVVVSGDDAAFPVLGYSTDRPFKTEGMPENLREWLSGYEKQVAYLRENGIEADAAVRAAWERPGTGTAAEASKVLATAEWNQYEPYNLKCPVWDGQQTLTGCIATASAILLRYYEWPDAGTGHYQYTTGKHNLQIDVALGESYRWDLMPLQEPAGGYTEEQQEAISTLMLHCGAVNLMDYGTDASWATDHPGISNMIRSFQLDPIADYLYRNGYSDGEWNAMLRQEIDAEHPLYYAACSYSSLSESHRFIIDGYKGQDYFHVNWGWGGVANGFFTMTIAGATQVPYVSNQSAVFNLKPNRDHHTAVSNTLHFVQCEQDGKVYSGMDVESTLKPGQVTEISLNGVWNNNPNTFKGSFLLALSDQEGNIRKELAKEHDVSLEPAYFILWVEDLCLSSSDFEPGNRLRLYSKGEGDAEWKWIRGGYQRIDMSRYITNEIVLVPDSSATGTEEIRPAERIIVASSGDDVWEITSEEPLRHIRWYTLSGTLLKEEPGNGANRLQVRKPASRLLLLQVLTDSDSVVRKVK